MPTTLFALLLHACGLSHREAAEFLGIRMDSVKSAASGRRTANSAVLDKLAALAETIDAAADEAVGLLPDSPGTIELGIAVDDAEARTLGWPCVGAHRAVIAMTAARAMAEGHRVEIVPRGSTPATAAAADIHERRG